VAEQSREEKKRTTAAQAKKGGQEAQGSHDEAFTAPTRRPDGHARDWKETEARRR